MAAPAEAIEETATEREAGDGISAKGGGTKVASHGGRGGGSSLERVTVNLTPRTSGALEQLVEITGDSKTDTIYKALQVFAYLQQLQHGDGAIYVQEPGSKERERLRIF